MKHGFRHPAWRVWAMPAALALSSALGMVLGLFGSGIWRLLAGGLMAWPVAVGLWHLRR
ncbi:hypothetical protein [Comamonas guangdongensis]|uniref:DUF4175 domain-containing protein n=1 Tax=Comamonas guangdongensis TaxID=510515 RepID=A0ABV4A015_9BURK